MAVSDAQNSDSNDVGTGTAPGEDGAANDFAQDAASWMKELGGFPPMMKHPTAAMAAATAVGFGMTSHFAGFMLGAMQGMVEAATKAAGTAEAAARQAMAEAERAQAAADAMARRAEQTAAAAATSPEHVTPAETAAEMPDPQPELVQAPVEAAAGLETVEAAPEETVAEPVAPVIAATELTEAIAPSVAAVVEEAAKTVPPKARRVATEKAEGAAPVRARRVRADDLKRIEGVGPKLEQVLKGLGVTRLADIAAWSDEDIKRFDAELGVAGRIVRDRWVEQAKALVKG